MRTAARAALLAASAALACACASNPLKPGARKEGIVVDARGSGPDRAAALEAAKRQAVASLVDLFVSSSARAASASAIEEKILKKPDQYLGKTKVLDPGPKTGAGTATLRALVLIPRLGRELDALGLVRPEGADGAIRVAIALEEPALEGETGRAADALRRRLVERGLNGIDLGDKTMSGTNRPKDEASALAAARRLRAHVLLYGKAAASAAPDERLTGTPAFSASIQARAILVTTAEELGPITAEATAVDLTATGAAGRALENAGELSAERLKTALEGRLRQVNEISVTIAGLGGVPEARKLLETLRASSIATGAALEGVVGRDVRLRVFVEKLSADDLAAGLLRFKEYRFAVRAVEPYYQSIELEAGGGI